MATPDPTGSSDGRPAQQEAPRPTPRSESKPWPMLTLIVSLEAIFLSTFVRIGQNRQADFQQAKADHDFNEQELELKTNTQLTRQIHTLTTELHNRLLAKPTRRR
jgi:uncharacterized membrane protein